MSNIAYIDILIVNIICATKVAYDDAQGCMKTNVAFWRPRVRFLPTSICITFLRDLDITSGTGEISAAFPTEKARRSQGWGVQHN